LNVAKVIEIIGTSQNGWEEAAQVAIDEAKKTNHGIHGLEIIDMTAKVDPNTDKMIEYRAGVKISFHNLPKDNKKASTVANIMYALLLGSPMHPFFIM
jgi:dodecin